MATAPTGIAVTRGALGNARNLATQIRAQGVPVVADAVINLQKQIDQVVGSISSVSTSVAAHLAPPTPGSNPAAPYTNLPTGFAITNSRYDLNSSGQQVLKLDATWTNPTDLRYGGSYIVRKKPSDTAPTVVMALNAGAAFTIMVSDFPTATESWQFWLISQDVDGNLNTSLTAPVTGTPTVTLSISPPLSGGSGTEFCANVSLGIVTQSASRDSNGVISNLVTANYTPPSDPKFGSVEIRIYSGVALITKNSSNKSPAVVSFPNPTTALTYTVKLVSLDVNGRANSEQVSTPQTTVSVGTTAGTLDLSYYLPSTFASFMTIVSLNITGLLSAVAIRVVNYLGSGIITDIVQGFDAVVGLNTGIVCQVNGGNQRVIAGPSGFFLINASNVQTGYFLTSGGTGLLSVFDTVGGGISLIANGGSANAIVLKSSSVIRVQIGVDGSNLGFCQMNWGGTFRFAPGVNANGKRFVWGSGTFNGATPAIATIVTGLSNCEEFFPIVAQSAGSTETAVNNTNVAGTVQCSSSIGGSTSGFGWLAIGT